MADSETLVAIGIYDSYTFICFPNVSFTDSIVSFAIFVCMFTKVNTIPEYLRSGFMLVLTSSIVLTSCVIPMAGRYCGCTGIRISSAATMALIVSIPRVGEQSIRT